MRRFLLFLTKVPLLRTIVWKSPFLQRLAGIVIHVCIPRIRVEPYGFVILSDWRNPSFLGICADGGYEKEHAAFMARTLRPGHTMVDVGANAGFFTVLASRAVGEHGRVLAIEPDPVALYSLRRNLRENDCSNVLIADVCLGDTASDRMLHTSCVSGFNSLIKNNILGASTPLAVRCVRLDDLLRERGIDRVDLIKVDIQGAEYACLRGAEHTIQTHRPVIIFEFWPEGIERAGEDCLAMLGQLHAWGYRLRCLEDPSINDTAMDLSGIVAAVRGRGTGYGGYANIAAEQRA